MLRRVLAPLTALLLGATLLTACSSSSVPPEMSQFSPKRSTGIEKLSAMVPNTYVNGMLSTKTTGPYLTDRFGRVVFLHGVNAVYKLAPYTLTVTPGQPNTLGQADALSISKLGFNIVRVGVIWAGLEPGTGGPNQPQICSPGIPRNPGMWNANVANAYLDQVARVVHALAQRHIYALLDMHQDIWSSVFSGEGAPAWATCTSGNPVVVYPGRWSNNYSNPAVDAAFLNFFNNSVVGGLQNEYDRAWKAVAERFKNEPWVVGYDPINEPLALKSIDGRSDRDYTVGLSCLYGGSGGNTREIGSKAVVPCPSTVPKTGLLRLLLDAAPKQLIFPEVDNATDHGQTLFVATSKNLARVVYNFHDYCSQRSGVTGNPTDLSRCSNSELVHLIKEEQLRPLYATKSQPNGPAIMMTEFGATSDPELAALLVLDASTVGLNWAWWSWRYYEDPTGSSAEALMTGSNTLAPTAVPLTQSHALAVAGSVLSSQFAQTTGNFSLTFAADPKISAPTVVYISPYSYNSVGYCAYVNGATITSKPGAPYLTISNKGQSGIVVVRVEPGHCVASQL